MIKAFNKINFYKRYFTKKYIGILLWAIAVWACPYPAGAQIITTIAGDGSATSSGDGGPATAAGIGEEAVAAVDDSGNVYIAANNLVRKVSRAGIITTIAGNGSFTYTGDGVAATVTGVAAAGVAADNAGNIYIADDNYRVRKVNSAGIITTVAGNGGIGGAGGNGVPATDVSIAAERVMVDGAGNLYIADGGHSIWKVNAAGIISLFAGGGIGIISDGMPATSGELANPCGMTMDGAGNVYFAEISLNRVRKVNSAGIISTVAGYTTTSGYSGDGGPATAAELFWPVDVALDGCGNVYVADEANSRIRKVNTAGIITTFAGSGPGYWARGFAGDGGPATAALLSSVYSSSIDRYGNLYISDADDNYRIRYVAARPPVFTGGHSQSLAVCENTVADSINILMAVMDSDVGQTETWSLLAAPAHGAANVVYSTTSTGAVLSTLGLYYTPASGYSGSDSFRVRVADCGGAADTTTIHVTINAAAIAGSASVCLGGTAALAGTPTGGTWSGGNAAVATVSATGIVTSVATGTTVISYTTPASCVVKDTVGIYAAIPAIGGPAIVCGGATITLSDSAAGGTWSSGATGTATAGAATGVVTGASAGTATITYTIGGACIASKVVTVNSGPGAITGSATVCAGLTITLGEGATGGAWGSSNTAVAVVSAGAVTGVISGTAIMSYLLSDGCSATLPVTVNPQPAAITGAASVCAGATLALSDAATGGAWSSSATGVATVGSTGSLLTGSLSAGIVTGVSAGADNITYTLPAGCKAVAAVTVLAVPAAITGPLTVCLGSHITLTDTSGSPLTGGSWTETPTTLVTISGSSADSATMSGYSVGAGTLTFTLSDGCSALHPMTVNPVPAPISGSATLCAGSTTALSDTGSGTWSTGSAAIATVGTAAGIVYGATSGTATIAYVNGFGCAATDIVTVNALPPGITGAGSVCGGVTTTLTDSSTGSLPGGSWSSNNTTVASVGAGSGIVTGGSVSSPSTAIVTYTDIHGCAASKTVTVNQQPSPISGASGLCAGATISLSSGPGGGSWSSSNTGIALVSAAGSSSTGIVEGVTGGTATIYYTLPTGCNSSTLVTIFPSPSPIAGIMSTCIGATTALSDTIPGGYWASSNTSVAIIDPLLGIVTGVATGTVTISYTLGTGCAVAATVTINNAPLPVGGLLTLCIGTTTSLSDAISGGSWSSGSTGVATVVGSAGSPSTCDVYGVNAGTATISYSVGTCGVTAIVTVNASPPAIRGVTEVCVGLATVLSDATTGGSWSSGNAAVASIVSATGILTGGGAGTATISYTLPDGCAVTTTETVNTTPSAITGNLYLCPGTTTLLTDPAAGGTGSGGGSWSSGNTAVATVGSTGAVVGGAVGTASIIYSIGAGCFTSTIVTVNPLPPAISGIEVLCAGSTTLLSDSSTGSLLIAGTWSSSNMSIATAGSASGIITGVSGGTANVTYTAGSTGCSAHTTLTINPLPLTIAGTLTVCSGSTTILNDHTAGGVWSSGNTAVATIGSAGSPSTGVATGITPGTSVITYTNSATGCATHVTLTIDPLPLTIGGTLSMCVGATATLLDATSGGLWATTAGSVATVGSVSGIVSGVSGGTAVVSYALPTGCARAETVTVNALPSITGPTAECVGAVIPEVASPTGGTWSSSVPTVATVGSAGNVTGVATGTMVITYTSSAGCRATTTITVSLSPTAIIGEPTVCAHDTTILSDAIAGGVWTSSNTAAATVGSLNAIVTGVAGGTTIITYSLGTGCTVTRIMTVNAAPDGITGTASLCIGATTMLADASTGGTWSSSAAGIATVTSTGVVTGGAQGIDTIIYTQGGCAVTTTVTVNLTPLAITGTGSVCAGDSIALSDAISGGVWTSSNTGIAEASAGVGAAVVTGMAPGTAMITYSLGAGCSVTKMITVNPISPMSGSLGMCLGTTTTLSDATTGGTWSSSTTSVASVGSASSPSTGMVTGLLAGTAVITYTTAAGCVATAVVTVNLAPSAIGGTLHVCAGATTALGNTAGGGIWTSGNTGVAMVGSTGTVTGIIPGSTTITYSLGSTGSLPSGCTVTAVVTVNAMPSGITGIMSMCAGTTTALVETSTGGEWSSGSTATATVSSTGMVSGVSGGTVTVSYGYATGCAATVTVTVNPLPALIVGTTHLCAGLTTTLTSVTTGGSWSSGNTGVAMADMVLGVISGVAPGTSGITYNLPSGCSTSITVTINAAPTAITGSLAVCIGSGTTLGDSSGGGVWSSSNTVVATVSPTGIVSGVALGTSMISYMAGGCPATAAVTINSLPGAISSTSVCVGSAETLTDLPNGGTWSSSNSAIASIDETDGVLSGVSAGTATIAYSLGAGCTVSAMVTVEELPGAITGTPEVCLGYVTTLIDAAGGGAWSSSNTAIATVSGTGAVNGISGGPVMISYTSISTGCAATRLVTVVAVPAITGVSDMCAFSAVMDVVDSLAGGTWTSTSVTVSTAGVVTPYAAGAASLTYTIPLGCYTTTSFTVHPLPGPVTGDFHFCVGLSAALGDTTSGGVWHSSNTAIASINTAGVVWGLAGGTATISYILPTGCMETEIITVDSIPVAGAITGLPVVCVSAAITLSDLSAGGVWSSSNASADVSGGMVSGISAGVDTIRYEVSNSCGSATTTKTIVVNPLPGAGAITGPAIVCVEDSIVLSDAVPGGTWSSSASATATIAGSILRGLTTGTDTIRYSVTNSCGTAVAVRIVTVNTLPDAGTISLIDTICTGFTYLLTDSIPGGAWSASNSSISVSAAGLISALSAGVDTITYSLTNICGTTSASAAIAVKAMSAPDTITGLPFVCEGGTDTLTVTPQGGVWGSSNGNVTITPTATGASMLGVLPGADTITYTMPGECSAAGGIYPITVLSVNQCDSNTGVSPQPSPKEREVLRVWPNPNDGTFSMLLSSAIDEGVEILITNVIGEKVREASTVTNRITEIKLNEAEGVYFINASSSGGSYEAKVVVGK